MDESASIIHEYYMIVEPDHQNMVISIWIKNLSKLKKELNYLK